MDELAERYVKLVLAMGQHDADYVDAYYGPEEWRETSEGWGLSQIEDGAGALIGALGEVEPPADADQLTRLRHQYLRRQLISLQSRVRILNGQALAFDGKWDISTQVNVPLKRGQVLLWSGYTVHRGRKPPDLEQRLSMTIGLFRYDPQDPKMVMDERFRWKLADNIRGSLPPRTQLFYDRWRALQPE